MGLAFAVFYDPQNAAQTPVLSEFLGLLATLIFLAMNGHLLCLAVLMESFQWLPVGGATIAAGSFRVLAAGWPPCFRRAYCFFPALSPRCSSPTSPWACCRAWRRS